MRGVSLDDNRLTVINVDRRIPTPHSLEIWLAYCAGLVDGEGSVGLSRGSNDKDGKADWVYPRIIVVNTAPKCLEPFQALWGSNLRSKVRENPNHKQCYYWQITGKKAACALVELIPYLVIKKAQAELIVEFQKNRPHVGRGIPLSEAEINRQDEIREKLMALNKRGATNRNIARRRKQRYQ